MEIDVSVITINYNNANDTIRCVESIIKHTSKDLSYEIIVVDNNSSKEDYTYLEQNLAKFEQVKLVRSRINTGFGGGNMMGVQHANGEYYAFVNNDSLFVEDCLSELILFMKQDPNVGVCGPCATRSNGEELPSFGHFHSLIIHFIGIKLYERLYNKPNPFRIYKKPIKVDFVVGSFMVFKSDVFCRVGGFDTNIFLYYEEMDICSRIKECGFSTYYFPESKYIHLEGKSTHNSKKWIQIRMEQQISYNYFFKKRYGILKYYILYPWVLIKLIVKSLFTPKLFPLFFLHLRGNSLTESFKQNQTIN